MIKITTSFGGGSNTFAVPITREQVQDAMVAGGARLADDLRDHYRIKDQYEPNRFFASGQGGRRVHFWRQVGDTVNGPLPISGGGVRVEVNDYRLNQKIHGGEIHAKNVRFLTIPMHAEAYARSAAELTSIVGRLFVVRKKDGRLFLAGKDEDKKLTFYYRLKESVTQKPWPGAVPTRRSIMDSFRNGVRYFVSQLRRDRGNA